LCLSSVGCEAILPGQLKLPLQREMAPLPSDSVCRVAVLPFVNQSDYPMGDAIVGKVFSAKFSASGYSGVIQEGDILTAYQHMRIFPYEELDLEQLQVVAELVGAQLLITGVIIEMRDDLLQHSAVNPRLVMEIQIRNGRSGETLWTIFHRRQGSEYQKALHFGTIYSMTGLTQQMAEEIITLMHEKGYYQCNVSSLH
jgi:hypothetical protein